MTHYNYKIASDEDEFEQIHQLNAETFTGEIPQHEPTGDGRLVDRFHEENTYVIARREDGNVVAMLAMRDRRPYSLDQKLDDLDDHLPDHDHSCEFRLLSVKPSHRNTRIFFGLLKRAARYCLGNGYDLGLISGHLDRVDLYENIGFHSFGPEVGTGDARFQPMYLTLASFRRRFGDVVETSGESSGSSSISLMPGPVKLHPNVRRAYEQKAISHRSDACMKTVRDAKHRLRKLTNADGVELFTGSGTLANEVVAAHLSTLDGTGLIPSNGEFGNRIIQQAKRWGLGFDVLNVPARHPINHRDLAPRLDEKDGIQWLWMVHCETSTGVLNSLSDARELARERNVTLCVDCISSLGTVPIDLNEVVLATGVSGKAIGARPGISFVLYNRPLPDHEDRLPRYLDIAYYRDRDGIPFTLPSNQIDGLQKALRQFGRADRFQRIEDQYDVLRSALTGMGYHLPIDPDVSSPAVLSIKLPSRIDPVDFGDELKSRGYLLNYRSRYLVEKNIVQICLMGDLTMEDVKGVLPALHTLANRYDLPD